jgi:hypothetical protein
MVLGGHGLSHDDERTNDAGLSACANTAAAAVPPSENRFVIK